MIGTLPSNVVVSSRACASVTWVVSKVLDVWPSVLADCGQVTDGMSRSCHGRQGRTGPCARYLVLSVNLTTLIRTRYIAELAGRQRGYVFLGGPPNTAALSRRARSRANPLNLTWVRHVTVPRRVFVDTQNAPYYELFASNPTTCDLAID